MQIKLLFLNSDVRNTETNHVIPLIIVLKFILGKYEHIWISGVLQTPRKDAQDSCGAFIKI